MLTGTEFLTKVNQMRADGASNSDIVRACGYEIDGKLKYSMFYMELLKMKEPEIHEDDEEVSEEYQKLCNTYGKDAVDAFIELYDEDCLESFEEAYYGRYDSEEDFAEDFMVNTYGIDIPDMIVVDWKATWNSNLRHDFYFEDGFVFNRNW